MPKYIELEAKVIVASDSQMGDQKRESPDKTEREE